MNVLIAVIFVANIAKSSLPLAVFVEKRDVEIAVLLKDQKNCC